MQRAFPLWKHTSTYFQFKQKHSDYKRCYVCVWFHSVFLFNRIALHYITFHLCLCLKINRLISHDLFFSSVLLSIIVCLMFELAHCIDLTFVNAIEHFLFCHSIGNRFAENQVGYKMARCKCDGIISRNLNYIVRTMEKSSPKRKKNGARESERASEKEIEKKATFKIIGWLNEGLAWMLC